MKRILSFLVSIMAFNTYAAITIGGYNIRNFDYDERYKIRTNKPALATIITSLNVDVLSVEEINNTKEFEVFVENNLKGYKVALSQCGGAHGQRLGFIYNSNKVSLLSFNEDLSIADPGTAGECYNGSRPLAIALFQIKETNQRFYAMTAHLKSGSKPDAIAKRTQQFEIIKNIINELKSKTGVTEFSIAGDFNTTEWLSQGSDYQNLSKVTRELGMVNLTAKMGCSAYWWGGTDDGIETPALLDHVIVTPGLLKRQTSAQPSGHCQKVACKQARVADLGVSYEGVSDHCPITATIQ